MLLPPVNPKDPLGVAVKAWLPTKLLAEVGVAGFTVVGTNALPAATALAHWPMCNNTLCFKAIAALFCARITAPPLLVTGKFASAKLISSKSLA